MKSPQVIANRVSGLTHVSHVSMTDCCYRCNSGYHDECTGRMKDYTEYRCECITCYPEQEEEAESAQLSLF